jgi:hypothetical protein
MLAPIGAMRALPGKKTVVMPVSTGRSPMRAHFSELLIEVNLVLS